MIYVAFKCRSTHMHPLIYEYQMNYKVAGRNCSTFKEERQTYSVVFLCYFYRKYEENLWSEEFSEDKFFVYRKFSYLYANAFFNSLKIFHNYGKLNEILYFIKFHTKYTSSCRREWCKKAVSFKSYFQRDGDFILRGGNGFENICKTTDY